MVMLLCCFYLDSMQQRQFVVKACIMQTNEKKNNPKSLSLDILSGYR